MEPGGKGKEDCIYCVAEKDGPHYGTEPDFRNREHFGGVPVSKKMEHTSGMGAKTGAANHSALRISNVAAWPNLAIRGERNRKGLSSKRAKPGRFAVRWETLTRRRTSPWAILPAR